MAILFPATSFHRLNSHALSVSVPLSCLLYSSRRPTNRVLSLPLRHRRLSPSFPSNSCRCLASKPGHPPPPPESDSPPERQRITGISTSLSKIQDRIQIFFAVLFWMSLFFWACVWDERNRPNKGSRFRR